MLTEWAEDRRSKLDAFISTLFADVWPTEFAEPCKYPLFGGGKRIRPLLTIAAFEAVCDCELEMALPAAAAVELIHTYSLVHDDLPCMDDDDERRGRPTVHKAYDEGTAVLVGDALLTEAFSVLARAACPAGVRVALIRELADASGHRGMVGGQAADIALGASITNEATLARVHQLKTGALIRAAVRMGALAGRASPSKLDQLTLYGEHLGLAFQLADDVLDADEAEDPKGPPSFVRLMGLEQTKSRAQLLSSQALQIADCLDSSVLRALARYTVEREV